MTLTTDAQAPGENPNPPRIWLSPICEDESGEGRTWSTERHDDCEDCNEKAVEYVRADLAPPRPEPSEAGETQLATLIDSIVRDVAQFEYQEDVISITSGQLRDALWTHLTRWVNYDTSVPQGLGSALLAANPGLSASPPPTEPSQDAEMIERLRKQAVSVSETTKMMAASKSARNQAAGDPDACYLGLEPEQTFEWKVADRLSSLSAKGETKR